MTLERLPQRLLPSFPQIYITSEPTLIQHAALCSSNSLNLGSLAPYISSNVRSLSIARRDSRRRHHCCRLPHPGHLRLRMRPSPSAYRNRSSTVERAQGGHSTSVSITVFGKPARFCQFLSNRRAERQRQRDLEAAQPPLDNENRRNRTIVFADEVSRNPSGVDQRAPPTPPPPARTRPRSPTPQLTTHTEHAESDSASVTSESRSEEDGPVVAGNEKIEEKSSNQCDEKGGSASTLVSTTVRVPPPTYSEAVDTKES